MARGAVALSGMTPGGWRPRAAESVAVADYYIATTGSNANPGTISQPWLTVTYAATQLTAGTTAMVRGGTYTEGNIVFTNSGTAGNRITIRGYPGETAIIDKGHTTTSVTYPDPVFYIDGRNYITLKGLTLRRGSQSLIFLSDNTASTNITIEDCTLENFVTDDNAAAIYINNGSDNIIVRNNVINGQITDLSPLTGSGVIIFNASNITIAHNVISNLYRCGVYYKHSNSTTYNSIVEYNIIHDINQSGMWWSKRDGIIRHNLIYNTNYAGILIFEEGASCPFLVSSGNQILHNTLVDCSNGIMLDKSATCAGAVDTIVRDNIVHNFTAGDVVGIAVWPYQATDTSNTTYSYNVTHSSTQANDARVAGVLYDGSLPGTVTSSNNLWTAPTYVNAAARDYTLASGSVGENAASDSTDIGVDFPNVGVE